MTLSVVIDCSHLTFSLEMEDLLSRWLTHMARKWMLSVATLASSLLHGILHSSCEYLSNKTAGFPRVNDPRECKVKDTMSYSLASEVTLPFPQYLIGFTGQLCSVWGDIHTMR